MKEFSPVNQEQLTTQLHASKLERRGDIFMAEPGRQEQSQPSRMTQEEVAARLERISRERERGHEEVTGEESFPSDSESTDDRKTQNEWLNYIDSGPMETKETRVKQALKFLSPHAGGLDTALIRRVIEYDSTLDYFVNRIISQPLDAEASDYRPSFYGGINLDYVKDELRTLAESDPLEKSKYERVLVLSEAVALFHSMNKEIAVTGNIEAFVGGSQAITPEQLQRMQRVKGVAQVMRLFDQEYQRILSENGYVSEAEYNKMLGRAKGISRTGGEEERTMGIVEQQLVDLVNKKTGESMSALPEELQGLDQWEMTWAFNVGKVLYNITLRAAEQISLSEVPKGPEGVASVPQESAVRIMNWAGWTGFRFGISKVLGGVKLLQMADDNYQDLRDRQGYGKTNLAKIGGKKINEFEAPGMFGVSGIWSSWRNETIILKNAPLTFTEQGVVEQSTVRSYIGDVMTRREGEIKDILKKNGFKGGEDGDGANEKEKDRFSLELERAKKRAEPEILRAIFLKDGQLNEDFTNSLGVLLKSDVINPTLVEAQKFPEIVQAKREIREAIWKRVSRDNPMAIVFFLNGMEFKKEPGFTEGRSMESFKHLTKERLKSENGTFSSLKKSLIIAQEIRLASIRSGSPRTLESIIGGSGEIKLSAEEMKLLRDIQGYGKDIAGELASIRFPYNPFMNDVIYESINYGDAGAEFYRRRAGGDLPSFHKAYSEFTKIMANPSSESPEEVLKSLYTMVQALGTPQGTHVGQDKVAPFLMAYLKLIESGGQYNSTFKRWLAKDNIYKAIAHAQRNRTSLAQEYAGPDAKSLDEIEMRRVIDVALKMGITRTEIKDKNNEVQYVDIDKLLRRKFKVQYGGILLALVRDLIPVFAAGAVAEFGSKTVKDK